MSQRRPIYLDLTRIQMPVTAAVSILHRISGVILFLALPFLLAGLQGLLRSQQSYDNVVGWLQNPLGKLTSVAMAVLFALHLAAGTRHLLLDLRVGLGRPGARRGAYGVLLFALLIFLAAVFLW